MVQPNRTLVLWNFFVLVIFNLFLILLGIIFCLINFLYTFVHILV